MLGIRDSVADVSSAFKKMAFLKQDSADDKRSAALFTDEPVHIGTAAGKHQLVEFAFVPPRGISAAPGLFRAEPVLPLPKRQNDRLIADENQLTMFDLVQISA